MREKQFTSFTPDSGSAGVTITISITGGLDDVQPQTLLPLGAVFTGEDGAIHTTQEVAVVDVDTYSEIDVRVPRDIVLEQGYNIEINLLPASPDRSVEGWKLTSATSFKVTGHIDDGTPVITGVRPNSAGPSEYFLTSTFTITGSNLMKVKKSSGATLGPMKRKFTIKSITPEQLVVKAAKSSPSLVDGTYYFNATDEHDESVRSGARVRVKKVN